LMTSGSSSNTPQSDATTGKDALHAAHSSTRLTVGDAAC
jgi:hypothetical protein